MAVNACGGHTSQKRRHFVAAGRRQPGSNARHVRQVGGEVVAVRS